MRKRICLFLLSFSLLLTACAPAAQSNSEPEPDPTPTEEASAPEEIPTPAEPPEPELPQRDLGWIEDIEFVREEYKTKHPDPFYRCPEEEFDWKLDRLIAKVGELSDSDIFYELNAIITGTMGDTHTKLWWDGPLPICNQMLAVNIFPLNGKLYLTSYLEGYEQFEPYLLHEIVGVNGVDSLYLMRRALELTEPFNWHSETDFPNYPTFYDWVGCDYRDGYTFQILNGNQEVESIEVPVITMDEWQKGTWIRYENRNVLPFAQGDRTAYCEGKDGGCIQWCIGEIWYSSNIWFHLREVEKLIEEHPDCHKLVVDLRGCPGGNADSHASLNEIRQKAQLLEGKQIYVLTWGATASAATRFIAFFKDEFGAVTVGEPTGEFSSFYSRGEEREKHVSILPHSQIKFKISDRWRDSTEILEELDVTPIYKDKEYYDEDGRIYPWETCIQPDVYVHLDIDDIRQGKDTLLEWVLAQ